MLERNLFQVDVRESEQGRGYWASRDWIGAAEAGVRSADIVVVPWEGVKENLPISFPQGTSDFVRKLKQAGLGEVALAATPETYVELALHAKSWRFPTLVLTALAFPTLAGFLSTEMHELVHEAKPNDRVELKIIVEGDHGKSISVDYKGPPGRAVETITSEVERYLPAIDGSKGKPVGKGHEHGKHVAPKGKQ